MKIDCDGTIVGARPANSTTAKYLAEKDYNDLWGKDIDTVLNPYISYLDLVW